MDIAKLKENAKKSLEGNYGQAIIMMIVYGVLTSIASAIPMFFQNSSETTLGIIQAVCNFATLVVTSFLMLGNVNFYLKLSRGEKVTWQELFSKTSLWVICFGITIFVGAFTFLWTLLLIIPGIIAAISYSMSYYILLDNENMTALEAIRKSKEMMNGHKMDFFMLNLSFLGWIILGIFTFGILYLWLAPYMSTAQANFYNAIKDNK